MSPWSCPSRPSPPCIGVPDADRHDLMAWSNTTLDFEGRGLGESNDQVTQAAASMAAYGSDLIADQAFPGEDIISVWPP